MALFCNSQLNITDCGNSMRLTVCKKQAKSISRKLARSDEFEFTKCNHEMLAYLFENEKRKQELAERRKKIKIMLANTETGEILRKESSVERSIRRARVMLVDLATLNTFDYFGTITIDDGKHDILNPVAILDRLLKWCYNYKQRKSRDFQYIIVPEYGEKTQRLHFHFLMSGLSDSDLFINEHNYLDFRPLKERFGHIQITKIGDTPEDKLHVAKYCSKYMTKDNIQIRSHRYFCSKSLKKPSKLRIAMSTVANKVAKCFLLLGFKPYGATQYGYTWGINGKGAVSWIKDFIKKSLHKVRIKSVLEEIDETSPFDQLSLFPLLS